MWYILRHSQNRIRMAEKLENNLPRSGKEIRIL